MAKALRVLFLCLLIFEASVWLADSAFWKYDHLGTIPIRTNRVTGQLQFATLNGWQPQLPLPEEGVPAFRAPIQK